MLAVRNTSREVIQTVKRLEFCYHQNIARLEKALNQSDYIYVCVCISIFSFEFREKYDKSLFAYHLYIFKLLMFKS